jgi:putative DNA primase/helicase
MSERMKPTELALVASNEVGEVVESLPELSVTERIRSTWKIHRGSSILEIPPQQWTVPGWIPTDSLVAVYAAPGVGKSFYALSMALEIARGGEWLGTPLEAAPVLYIAGERLTTLRDRAEAWSTYHEELNPENLIMPEFTGRTPQLRDGADVLALCELIEAEGVRFVVIDTYATLTQGLDENAAGATGEVMGYLQQIRKATKGGTVLLVHHAGKNATAGMRGSTAFLGAVDMTHKIEPAGDGRLSATVDMSNAGASPLPEYFEIVTVPLEPFEGEPRSSAILKSTGAPKRNEHLEELTKEILRNSAEEWLTMNQLLEALSEQGQKIKRQAFSSTALKPLLDRGEVVNNGKTTKGIKYRLSPGVI